MTKFNYIKQSNHPTEYAYVLTVFKNSEYMLGALACAYSIKQTQTSYNIVCMVTDDIDTNLIDLSKQVFDTIVKIPYISAYTKPLRTNRQNKIYESWKECSFTKWNCLGLTEYKKIIFIDADKIILENVDHLFDLSYPAGTFSIPQAQGYAKQGIYNPYLHLTHQNIVPNSLISEGLNGKGSQDSFVVIGTMVLLAPSESDYNLFVNYIHSFTPSSPFGFPLCNSMFDEQALVNFYLLRDKQWTYISQKYNFIPWRINWLSANEKPSLIHYFNIKPWILPRKDWIDLEVWWDCVECMINDIYKNQSELKELYRKEQFDISQVGCFYCKQLGREWVNHNFTQRLKITCPSYLSIKN